MRIVIIVDNPSIEDYNNKVVIQGTRKEMVLKSIEHALNATFNYQSSQVKPELHWVAACKEPLPPGKEPTKLQWHPYRHNLVQEVLALQPDKVLCLGAIALSAWCVAPDKLPITKWRGGGMCVNGVFTVATYRPLMIVQNPDHFRDFHGDIRKLIEQDSPKPSKPFKVITADNFATLHQVLKKIGEKTEVVCDLETYSISTDEYVAANYKAYQEDYDAASKLGLMKAKQVESKWLAKVEETFKDALDPVAGRIESLGLGYRNEAGVFLSIIIPRTMLEKNATHEMLGQMFGSFQGTLVFHNAKFDLKFLQAYLGKPLTCKIADTMIMHYALDERPIGSFAVHGLKLLSRRYYDADAYEIEFKVFYSKPFPDRDYRALFYYQSKDLLYTYDLYFDLMQELEKCESPKLKKVTFNLMMPATHALAEIEYRGVLIDAPHLQEHSERLKKWEDEVVKEIQERFTGPDFTPHSPKQVVEFLWDRWRLKTEAHGKHDMGFMGNDDSAGAGKDVLIDLQSRVTGDPYDFIDLVLKARKIHKFDITYFQGLLDARGDDDRIRTQLNIAGTATGRLSSSKPINLQNIPARQNWLDPTGGLVRNAFIAGPGNVLIQRDFAQLELRTVAFLAQDEKMAATFRDGVDIHRLVASQIFNKPQEQVTKEERHLAKSIVFGIVYGRGAKTLAEGFEMDAYVAAGGKRLTVAEAQGFIDVFLDTFPQMKKWMYSIQASTLKNQFSESLFGRRRRWPLRLGTPQQNGEIKRAAVNTPVQSMASDLCLRALVELHRTLPEGAYVCFSVHDSIIVECREDLVSDVLEQMRISMEVNHGLGDFIPFATSAEVGPRWGSLKEVK
jgi:DNA polymerase I-like protein with 3'-5' exonuclease and polymerase domains